MSNVTPSGPHQGQPVIAAGQSLESARAAMILLHQRGGVAQSILTLTDHLSHPALAYRAPQAAGHTWYPERFIAPVERNEPFLSSALALVAKTVAQVEDAGIPAKQIVIGGFSQGACLAAEFVARTPRRYGGLFVFSGGLIGATLRDYAGSLDGTPVFIGCSDVDFHIPLERVHATTAVFEQLGATVTERIYPGMGHTINQDEIDRVQQMIIVPVLAANSKD